ncbi:MAG: ribonuclease H family protein [Lagierella massiliensis]|nr:ribonuclease H family protein [Lagierella massiliensis]
MAGSKYYAVKKGRKPGIYNSWDQCKKQIDGFSGAVFKKFSDKLEAKKFIEGSDKSGDNTLKESSLNKDELVVYVDGSFNSATKVCGYGVVFLFESGVKKHFDKVYRKDYSQYRNVTGEVFGSIYAIKKAIELGFKKIYIHFDYLGIREWAVGNWKANNPLTKSYVEEFKELNKKIEIEFIKVESHTGVLYNELADKLAKKGAGL